MKAAVRFVVILIGLLTVIGLGIVGLILGEADDSPGLQAIGVVLVVVPVVVALRTPHTPKP